MSTDHTAHLVYGYHLGHADDHLIEEVSEYGALDMPWIKRDPEGYLDETLAEAVTRRLYEAIPGSNPSKTRLFEQDDIVWEHYGVKLLEHGWIVEGITLSYALVAHETRCYGGDAERISLMDLVELESFGELDRNLARALKILEITPKQKQPRWLLLASR